MPASCALASSSSNSLINGFELKSELKKLLINVSFQKKLCKNVFWMQERESAFNRYIFMCDWDVT